MILSHMRNVGCVLCLTAVACSDDGNNESGTTSEMSGATEESTSASTTGDASTTSDGSTNTLTGTSSESDTSNPTSDSGSTGNECPTGELQCVGNCVDPQTDENFCGASGSCMGSSAGVSCRNDQTCVAGECLKSCIPGEVRCDGTCIDPDVDLEFCGASGSCVGAMAGRACDAEDVCFTGRCMDTCGTGYIKCDDRCIDPQKDVQFCGAVDDCSDAASDGTRCDPDEVCLRGNCESRCPSDLLECNAECVDPQMDPRYCGATDTCFGDDAGENCDGGSACIEGECQRSCTVAGSIVCDGHCVDPEANPWYCGARGECSDDADKGEVCDPGESCVEGLCERVRVWSEVVDVDDDTEDVSGLVMAGNTAGVRVAVWIQDGDIMASVFDAADDSWGSPQVVDRETGTASDLSVAVDEAGNAVAVWVRADEVYGRGYDERAQGWRDSEAVHLSESITGDHSSVALSVGRRGLGLVTWIVDDGDQSVHAMQWKDDAFTGALEIDAPSEITKSMPRVAVNSAGDGVIVWLRSESGDDRVYARRVELDNSDDPQLRDLARVDSVTGFDAKYPQVHTDDAGNALVVWVRAQMTDRLWWSRISDTDDTQWDDPDFISRADGLIDTPQLQLRGNREGAAAAVWLRSDGASEPATLYSAIYDGQSWEAAASLQAALGDGESIDPAVSVDEEGDAIVLFGFDADSGGARQLHSREWSDRDGEWSDSIVSIEAEANRSSSTAIHLDADGDAVGVWQQDVSAVDLRSSRYAFEL